MKNWYDGLEPRQELEAELEAVRIRETEILFWLKVIRRGPNECWDWTGARTKTGYGHMRVAGKDFYVHRFAYDLLVDPIPEGLVIDHLCRNRLCVNPTHLEAVPQRRNVLRGEGIPAINYHKTECPHGHPYTPENTYIQTVNGRNHRSCLTCRQTRDRARSGR